MFFLHSYLPAWSAPRLLHPGKRTHEPFPFQFHLSCATESRPLLMRPTGRRMTDAVVQAADEDELDNTMQDELRKLGDEIRSLVLKDELIEKLEDELRSVMLKESDLQRYSVS